MTFLSTCFQFILYTYFPSSEPVPSSTYDWVGYEKKNLAINVKECKTLISFVYFILIPKKMPQINVPKLS